RPAGPGRPPAPAPWRDPPAPAPAGRRRHPGPRSRRRAGDGGPAPGCATGGGSDDGSWARPRGGRRRREGSWTVTLGRGSPDSRGLSTASGRAGLVHTARAPSGQGLVEEAPEWGWGGAGLPLSEQTGLV